MGSYSRQLRDAETRYSATELECLVVVEAVRHFEVLHGRPFNVETDHRALESLLSSRVRNRKLTTRRALFLQEFPVTITCRSGKKNQNTDGLSRQAWT